MNNHTNNPFEVEELREQYAKEGNWRMFKKTYSSSFPAITDHNTKQAWERLLQDIPSSADPMTTDRIELTARLIDPAHGKRLLDIGIGNGWVEEKLEAKHQGTFEFTGVDITPDNLKALSTKLPGIFTRGDILDLPQKIHKNSYDYVLLLEVLEHIPFIHTFQALETIKSLLTPGGFFIISVPIYENVQEKITLGTNYSHHVRRYTPDIIIGELRCTGFKVIKQHTLYAFNSMYYLKSWIARLTGMRKPNVIILKCTIDKSIL